MANHSKELVFLILQFLDEENLKETVHKLEQESGVYFNFEYFSELVKKGEWDAVEKYLSGYSKFNDNKYSKKIFFEIQKQKYLEALDRNDCAKAVEILKKELIVYVPSQDELYKDLALLLTLENFRENKHLAEYGDTNQAREKLLTDLKKLFQSNPLFDGKLQFPNVKNCRLRTLIKQGLSWQHKLCKDPNHNPEIQTLFMDHSCLEPHAVRAPSPSPDDLTGGVRVPHTAAPAPLHPTLAQFPASRLGWMVNLPLASAEYGNVGGSLNHPDYSTMLWRPMTPNTLVVRENQIADPGHVLTRPRAPRTSDDGSSMAVNMVPGGHSGQSHTHGYKPTSTDNLPNQVIMTLNQGSSVESMDFHPVQQLLLLVGTSIGDTAVWEIATRKNLAVWKFKVWDLGARSVALKASLEADNTISTNHVKWSPGGKYFGVAFSKNIVQIKDCHDKKWRNHLEIEAHPGSVNDIAFANPKDNLAFITCGDDKVVKVWDVLTGANLFSFEGHHAPVYSVCPHKKDTVRYLFSCSTEGKIKAWFYNNSSLQVDHDAPGGSSLRMAYSTDGTRLFSCGTNKQGESHLIEWSDREGVVNVKQSYRGLGKLSVGIVQFDTAKNRFLAVGDESVIKFWDMDQVDVLTTTDAEGGLPASPCLKISLDGRLLAVSTNDSGIKILANGYGAKFLHDFQNRAVDPSSAAAAVAPAAAANALMTGERVTPVAAPKMCDMDDTRGVKRQRLTGEPGERSRVWKLTEINEPSECRSLKLPDNFIKNRISRLIYTHSGVSILALASNGVHKIWKWAGSERNPNGRATTRVVPRQIQPHCKITMVNEMGRGKSVSFISCFALSNNDSYLISASGGKISLYNMSTFKSMAQIMEPPPAAATVMALHPENNNIIAIGFDDLSILICNIRTNEVQAKLCHHCSLISGLAFSTTLKVLVSAGNDSTLCVWSSDRWENLGSKRLQMPHGQFPSPFAETRVQFHEDQMHLLVVHETQICIYRAAGLECLKQWDPSGFRIRIHITHATYSCDSESIYVGLDDGSVAVLTSSSLSLRCRIKLNSYLPANPNGAYPIVIAAHPAEPSQFALGMSDGGVVVMEPNSSEGQWGTAPPN